MHPVTPVRHGGEIFLEYSSREMETMVRGPERGSTFAKESFRNGRHGREAELDRRLQPVAIRPGRIKRKDECAEARRRARDRRGKSVGPMRRTRHVGRFKIRQQVELTGAAYNLVRMAKLLGAA